MLSVDKIALRSDWQTDRGTAAPRVDSLDRSVETMGSAWRLQSTGSAVVCSALAFPHGLVLECRSPSTRRAGTPAVTPGGFGSDEVLQ
ncbi:hypothetical protein AAFF_G00094610 [Aldrovandia affinis]|uniref:Uncharacterized protein n=1 Tax=Aldrovandia affinis TaxID=143900 RepID=A0AAD7T311_9TELE|nr:hypothetical protein AAFF_G00094610 [Aldrovandia affinis]